MRKRILIVEDEEAIAKMIAMNLRAASMDPVIFYDGAETAASLEEDHDYDLAVLDVMVPGLDGFELLEVLKPYDIPVLFLTARDDVGSKVQGLENGAEDYMVKPFEVLELLVRINKIIDRKKKQGQEKIIHVLDMEINFEERTVRKQGIEIPLKPMEFELLGVLAKNKNIAISRDNLLRMVWGIEYMGETRTVDVHIGQLRKKLGLHRQIKTISKMGYRLEESD